MIISKLTTLRVCGVVLFVISLSGCTGTRPPRVEPDRSLDLVPAPSLAPGDWFRVESRGIGGLAEPATYDIIVLESTPEGYLTGTSTKTATIEDLVWGNPWVGHLDPRLDDAAETDESGFPRLLDFPLTPGKTWESVGFGLTYEFSARPNGNIGTAFGTLPGYEIEGRPPEGASIHAVYLPILGWFGNLSQRGNLLTTVDAGHDYKGDAWTGETLEKKWLSAPSIEKGHHIVDLTVTGDATHLYVFVAHWSVATFGAALVDPTGDVYHTFGASLNAEKVTVEGPEAGTWRLVLDITGAGGGIYYRMGSLAVAPVQW